MYLSLVSQSIRPELTGVAMVLKDCPDKEDLNILTDSLSAIVLLWSLQRKDLQLWLYWHTKRQLLQHTVQLDAEPHPVSLPCA